jgi:hypothetical protein
VAVGVATTVEPFVVLSVPPGLHVYVLAPLALNVALDDGHTVEAEGVIVIVGSGFTVTVI